MKLVNFTLIGMGILVSSAIFGGQTSHAAEASKAVTESKFELEAGGETVPEILDPEIKPPTGQKGPLSLDAVSNFTFPTKKLGTEANAPLEVAPLKDEKLGLQLTDERGQDIGWNLKVSATAFKTSDDKLELKGAVMTIPEGKLATKEGVDLSLTPTAHAVALSTTQKSIMVATSTQGRSTWVNSFEGKGEKVTLAVPSGNKVAAYKSTITWSLEDAP